MPKKETKALVIFLLLASLGALILFLFLYIFTTNQISDTISKSDEIKTEITKTETLSLMKNDITYGKTYENNLLSYVVGMDDVSGFLKILEHMVASSSLDSHISSIDYVQSNNLSAIGAQYIKISMHVIGSWKDINYFIEHLENYPLKIDIHNMTIARLDGQAANKKPKWFGEIQFTVIQFKK